MDACDKNKIPPVDHANYSLSEEDGESDFALPGVNVTYTCVEGYHLMDPSNNIVGCDQPQRNDQGVLMVLSVWKVSGGQDKKTTTNCVACTHGNTVTVN